MMSEDLSLKIIAEVLKVQNLLSFFGQSLLQELALDINLDVEFLHVVFLKLFWIGICAVFSNEFSQELFFLFNSVVSIDNLLLKVIVLLLLSFHMGHEVINEIFDL